MSTIGAVIMAAGTATRMGQPKQVMSFLGKPLFHYSVEASISAGLKPIVVVGGNGIQQLHEHAAHFKEIEVIENNNYKSGMASSLQAGIQAVSGRADAAAVLLADQPLVPSIVIKQICRHYDLLRKEGIRIVRPEYGGTPGHPVLFDAGLFPEFASIQGDDGGKSIINKYRSRLHMIPFPNPEWGYDIDTPEDLPKLEIIANHLFDTQ